MCVPCPFSIWLWSGLNFVSFCHFFPTLCILSYQQESFFIVRQKNKTKTQTQKNKPLSFSFWEKNSRRKSYSIKTALQNIQILKPVYFNLTKLERKESERKKGKSLGTHFNYLCQFCKICWPLLLPALKRKWNSPVGIKKTPAVASTPGHVLFLCSSTRWPTRWTEKDKGYAVLGTGENGGPFGHFALHFSFPSPCFWVLRGCIRDGGNKG